MTYSFESEKNKKALLYTAIICAILLLLFILIKWRSTPPSIPTIQELIEVNLGNEMEGMGDVQPLIKGNPTPTTPQAQEQSSATQSTAADQAIQNDDHDDASAAVLAYNKKNTKPVASENKSKQTNTKPILTYNGPNKGNNGNNGNEDNGYTYQGNKPNGKGDAGNPNGDKDSYGNNPGGNTGGPKVTKGNRKITKYYSFTSELNKATIYAIINVSPSGKGSFVGFDKGSTSRSQAYAQAISSYLHTMQFNADDEESTVTVQFNFSIN